MKQFNLLLFMIFFINCSFGQKHQISPGFGVLTTNSFLDIISNVGKNTVGGVIDGSKLKNKRYVGDFRISYAYDISNSFSMGMTLSYLKASGDYYKSGEFVGDQRINYYSVGADATFYYMKKTHIKMYGLIGVGASFVDEEDRSVVPEEKITDNSFAYINFQISPFGIAAGGERIGAFAEFGFGYRGLFSTGLYVRL